MKLKTIVIIETILLIAVMAFAYTKNKEAVAQKAFAEITSIVADGCQGNLLLETQRLEGMAAKYINLQKELEACKAGE